MKKIETFRGLMEDHGVYVKEIERYPKNAIPIGNLEVVKGATGNY